MQQRLVKSGLEIDVVHCPERAIPGNTLHELINNDRIVGASSERSAEEASKLYASFVKGDILHTDPTTAECGKLIENTSRDVQIAFANELSEVLSELGVNCTEAIRLANRHPRVTILNPGLGVGGHCIPIDPYFLVENTKSGDLIRRSRAFNSARPNVIAEKLHKHMIRSDLHRLGILGLAYKPNVDDCRESPAIDLLNFMRERSVSCKYHDPYVDHWDQFTSVDLTDLLAWADVIFLATEHELFIPTLEKSELPLIRWNSKQLNRPIAPLDK
jgi:UDP-N-acetylglucosamine 2-epimerase (non-hydrolysing)